jgi:hypothetical protein
MEKVIRDGMVAVLYSPDYGAGWSTWAHDSEVEAKILFDANIVGMIESGASEEDIEEYCINVYPDLYVGWEEIVLKDQINWSVA